jgi:hypothetical protein
MSKRFVFLFLVHICALPLFAQTWEVGGFVGASGYIDDPNQPNITQFNDLAVGAQLKRNFDPYWSAKLIYLQTQKRISRHVSELSLQVEFNFLHYLAGSSRTRISPFLFSGIGFVDINDPGPPAKPHKDFSIPYGIGIKYNIKGNWNLNTDIGYRKPVIKYTERFTYMFAGLSLTYTFVSRKCPVVGN